MIEGQLSFPRSEDLFGRKVSVLHCEAMNHNFQRYDKRYLRQATGIAQVADCLLPKQNVVGSNPITRLSCLPHGPP